MHGLAVIAEEVDVVGLGIEFDFGDPNAAPRIVMHLYEIHG